MTAAESLQFANTLLTTPLFQGMCRADLQDVIKTLGLAVERKHKGEIIIAAGEACGSVTIVLDGTVSVATRSTDSSYEIIETLVAPQQFQAERLFGQRMLFTSTVKAAAPCRTITIAKRDVLSLFDKYDIFRINLLNQLVVKLQREEARNWSATHYPLPRRIALFILRHCQYPAGAKTLRITMNALAAELNASRINVSNALNSLRAQGLIELTRGIIRVPALETLYERTAT
ncbi:MAG: Crp/Fnr family transcriptional regulator [Prevotella sp.]|nr:Crp/Fnr family transcriptional regulator [Prevotella sp.]